MSNLIIQPAFSAGEIGPELYGRVDNQLYYAGGRTVENFIVQQYGGLRNRHGTEFSAPCRYPDRHAVGIDFQYSTQQAYALEFGHLYMRVYKDGEQVLEANKTITGITSASPAVVTSAAHGFSNDDDVFISAVVGMDEINGRWFRVKNVAANTFELYDYHDLPFDTQSFSAYASAGTAARVFTLVTPFIEGDLDDLSWTQNKDVLTICHPSYYPRDISRTGHTSWTIDLFNAAEGPFQDINIDTTVTVQASAVTGAAITITASSALFNAAMVGELFYIQQTPDDTTKRWEVAKAINTNDLRRADANYYKALNTKTTGTFKPDWTEGTSLDGDDGVQWQYLHSGFGIVKITGFTNSTHVTATVVTRLPELTVSTTSYNWAKAAWSASQGYPATSIYHQSRMVFGGTSSQPQTLFFSGSGLRTYFGRSNPILADDALNITLDALQVNAIRNLMPLTSLIALTSASEILISGQSNKTILATETPLTQVQGFNGCSKVRPIIINNLGLFVQEGQSVTRSLIYTLDSDTFTGINLMARSPHIFALYQLRRWAYAKSPYSVVWAVRTDGQLAGLTFLKEQEVYAWHRHTTDGEFTSLCVVHESSEDSTYLVVKRTVGGKTERYFERMRASLPTDIREAYYVDCGASADGRNTTATTMTISGGTGWDEDETLTLTASSSYFTAAMVGDAIVFRDAAGVAYRLTITAYTSATVVSASPNRIVVDEFRNTATDEWEFATRRVGGLWHLEGKSVSLLVDGNVHPALTVSNGGVVLQYHGSVIHAGLGYCSTLETLDMTTPQQNLRGMTFNIPRIYIALQNTRGLWIGEDSAHLTEYKQRTAADGFDAPLQGVTDTIEHGILNSWNSRGRMVIQQLDPLPAHILSVVPEVVVSRQGSAGP